MVTTTNRYTKLNPLSTISVGQLSRRHCGSMKSQRNLIDIAAKILKEREPTSRSTDVGRLVARTEKPPKSIENMKRQLRKNRGIHGIYLQIRTITV